MVVLCHSADEILWDYFKSNIQNVCFISIRQKYICAKFCLCPQNINQVYLNLNLEELVLLLKCLLHRWLPYHSCYARKRGYNIDVTSKAARREAVKCRKENAEEIDRV